MCQCGYTQVTLQDLVSRGFVPAPGLEVLSSVAGQQMQQSTALTQRRK